MEAKRIQRYKDTELNWDTDLIKSVYFFLNPICILLDVVTSTIAVCM